MGKDEHGQQLCQQRSITYVPTHPNTMFLTVQPNTVATQQRTLLGHKQNRRRSNKLTDLSLTGSLKTTGTRKRKVTRHHHNIWKQFKEIYTILIYFYKNIRRFGNKYAIQITTTFYQIN